MRQYIVLTKTDVLHAILQLYILLQVIILGIHIHLSSMIILWFSLFTTILFPNLESILGFVFLPVSPCVLVKNQCDLCAVLQFDINVRPAAPKTSVDRCCAAPCRAAAPPRDSPSMVERMLWRHVSARDCTRCILKGRRKDGFCNTVHRYLKQILI